MAGNKAGAQKALATRLQKNPNYFAEVGAKGGAKSKGRKLSAETRKKISKAKRKHKEADDENISESKS